MLSAEIVAWLEREAGIPLDPASVREVSGGCIHRTLLADRRDGGSVFLKLNRPEALSVFEAEQRSLRLLAASGTLRVPAAFARGLVGGVSILALEGLDLHGRGGADSDIRLADGLAAMHATRPPGGRHGADFDNFIGSTPQANGWCADWGDFFVVRRLEPQLRLAAARGRPLGDAERLLVRVRDHLAALPVEPSLLHGDFWSGNAGFLPDGEPVVYDPAAYFGDRETDLAFARLFGGFGEAFHQRYREHAPAPEPIRETIYNLYHLLNHDHLFGGGYASSAAAAARTILRELG